ncbi:MAG: VWA domain-containing protein [bacterium]
MRTLTVALALLAPLAAHAESVHLDMRLGTPAVEAGRKQTAYLKVGLTGALERKPTRVPVSVALVIDKSGSMSGDKIRRAKDAALMAIDRLGPDDIVSVVAYDTRVSVLVPATKAGDKESIRDGIARLCPAATPRSSPASARGRRAAQVLRSQPGQPPDPALGRAGQRGAELAGRARRPGRGPGPGGHDHHHPGPGAGLQRGPDAGPGPRHRRQPRLRRAAR